MTDNEDMHAERDFPDDVLRAIAGGLVGLLPFERFIAALGGELSPSHEARAREIWQEELAARVNDDSC